MSDTPRRNLKDFLASLEKKRTPIYIHKAANSTGYHADVVEVDDVLKVHIYSNYYGDNPSEVIKAIELGKFNNQTDADLKKQAQIALDDFNQQRTKK
jgi:hypothetical protein